jgi:hypothetical protein
MRKKTDKKCMACGQSNCGCKGYSYGTDAAYADPVQEAEIASFQGTQAQINPNAIPPQQGPSEAEQMAMGEAQKQGMTYAKDQGAQAFAGQTRGAIMDTAMNSEAVQKAGDTAFEAVVGSDGGVGASEAVLSAANDAAAKATADAGSKAGAEAVKAAGGGALNSALSGMGGAAAADLLTKGKVDEKTLLKGGLAMGANMLLPGSGFLVGPAMAALGLKDGMMEVPPMGYANGTTKMTPVEERQAPLLLAAEKPDYRRLSSGGWADLNFSKRTLEQNKKAREDHYKRIQEAMQAAQ